MSIPALAFDSLVGGAKDQTIIAAYTNRVSTMLQGAAGQLEVIITSIANRAIGRLHGWKMFGHRFVNWVYPSARDRTKTLRKFGRVPGLCMQMLAPLDVSTWVDSDEIQLHCDGCFVQEAVKPHW